MRALGAVELSAAAAAETPTGLAFPSTCGTIRPSPLPSRSTGPLDPFMRLVPKLAMALLAGVFLVVAVFTAWRVRGELSTFDRDIRRDQRVIGLTAAAAVSRAPRDTGSGRRDQVSGASAGTG